MQPPATSRTMKHGLVTLSLAAAMLACGTPPKLDVQAFAVKDGRDVLLGGETGIYRTTAGRVRFILTVSDPLPWEEPLVSISITAALDRETVMATKEATGRSVRTQLLDAEAVLNTTSIGPAELVLDAEHPCCTGSMWRVDTSALGVEQQIIVWAHDAPGDTLEGD